MILEGVTPEMKLNDTESFGPIFAIEKFTDVNNVVDVVNESDFGLKASIWSSNLMNAIDLAKRIECGGFISIILVSAMNLIFRMVG